jgi:hypothetical protein
MKFYISKAFKFYKEVLINETKFRLLKEYNLRIPGCINPVDWELFGAILTGDKGKSGYGSDLGAHEIKSAVVGASFEYQYHLNADEEKLKEDMKVAHIFISYSPNYMDLTIRYIKGEDLAPIFVSWHEGLIKNYQGEQPRQRYRKSISYGKVTELGRIILQIKDGQLVS